MGLVKKKKKLFHSKHDPFPLWKKIKKISCIFTMGPNTIFIVGLDYNYFCS